MAKSREGVGAGSKHESGKVQDAIEKLREVVSLDGNRKVTYLEAMANSKNKEDVKEVKRLISIINSANNKNMRRMDLTDDYSFAYIDRLNKKSEEAKRKGTDFEPFFTVKGLSGKALVTEAQESMKYYRNKSNTVTGFRKEVTELSEEFSAKLSSPITKQLGRWVKRAIDELIEKHPSMRSSGAYNVDMIASFATQGKWNEEVKKFEDFDSYIDFYNYLEEYFYPTNGKIEENANSKSFRF